MVDNKDYLVSDRGHVFSKKTGLMLKWMPHRRSGYPVVCLRSPGKQKRRYVHHLVLEAFVGPRPGGMEARHRNGDPTDPTLENLAWGTHMENEHDKRDHGSANGKLTKEQVRLIRSAPPGSAESLSKEMGVGQTAIYQARRGETYRWVD